MHKLVQRLKKTKEVHTLPRLPSAFPTNYCQVSMEKAEDDYTSFQLFKNVFFFFFLSFFSFFFFFCKSIDIHLPELKSY